MAGVPSRSRAVAFASAWRIVREAIGAPPLKRRMIIAVTALPLIYCVEACGSTTTPRANGENGTASAASRPVRPQSPDSSVRTQAGDEEDICAEADASIIPAQDVVERDVGIIERATFRKTELPRPNGRTAIVLTGIAAVVRRSAGTFEERQGLAYIEDRQCWDAGRRGAAGYFECFDISDPPRREFPTAVREPDTRRFLSVVVYLATGGESDAAFRQVASGRTEAVPMDLTDLTSAPSHISDWYFCQSCSRTVKARIRRVEPNRLRFGRSRIATYFIAAEGIAARLPDDADYAAYANCSG